MVPSLSKLCVSNVHRIESRILETNLALSLKARDDSYACANYLREAYKEHIPPSPPRKKPNQPTNQPKTSNWSPWTLLTYFLKDI